MTTICAWCLRDGRVQRPAGPVSHGICREHARQLLADVGLTLERDRDNLARPAPAAQEQKEAA